MNQFDILEKTDLAAIDKSLAKEIEMLITKGQEFTEHNNAESVPVLISVWDKLPEPKNQWDMSGWASSSLFEAYMALGRYAEAKPWAEITLTTRPSDFDTREFVYLGMVSLELKELDAAYKWFDLAFELGKKRAFQGEKPKYLNFYLTEKAKR